MLIQIHWYQKLIKKYWGRRGHKWVCCSGHRSLNFAVSLKEINGVNWFLVCWYKFRKAKNYFNSFWVVAVKNEHSLLGHGFLKSAISQEWIDDLIFCMLIFSIPKFVCWYKFRNAKYQYNNHWLGMLQNVRDLLDHGTLKSGVCHKRFDE